MKRPTITRLPDGRPVFTILTHDPESKGRPRTCTVRNNRTGQIAHGPDTDYASCVRQCHRLSMGEDIFPFEVIQRSVEQMSMRLEA